MLLKQLCHHLAPLTHPNVILSLPGLGGDASSPSQLRLCLQRMVLLLARHAGHSSWHLIPRLSLSGIKTFHVKEKKYADLLGVGVGSWGGGGSLRYLFPGLPSSAFCSRWPEHVKLHRALTPSGQASPGPQATLSPSPLSWRVYKHSQRLFCL